MLLVLLAILLMLAAAALLFRDRERELYVSGAKLPRLTVTAIYCLDCSGEELLPVKTFLTSAGRCGKCAGRSYSLATVWAPAIRERLGQALRLKQARERTREIERKVRG